MMQCTNICQGFKVKKPEPGISRYGSGQKYCSHCGVFMKIDNSRCPCCNYMLKTRSTKRRDENSINRM